jgi:hypothetical protein
MALVHENDYYNPAHFIKGLKELVGVAPKEFHGKNLKMRPIQISPK